MATSPSGADESSLSIRQQRAIVALGAGASKVEAAKAANVARETVHEWLRDPRFREAVMLESEAGLEEARTRFRSLASKAADTLELHLNHPNFEAALRAAGIITKELKLFTSRKEVVYVGPNPETTDKQLMEALVDVREILKDWKPEASEMSEEAGEAYDAETGEEPEEAGDTPLNASTVAPELS